ncbi:MAG: transcriptional repressor [Candidatus Woesebacteria bacterium]
MSRPATVQPAILLALEKHHILSPNDLQKSLSVNKTTIYRALEKLVESGKICKQVFRDDQLMYELRDSHHDHLVCETCGKVEAISCVTNTPHKIKDFAVNHHHTTLFGTCSNCRH